MPRVRREAHLNADGAIDPVLRLFAEDNNLSISKATAALVAIGALHWLRYGAHNHDDLRLDVEYANYAGELTQGEEESIIAFALWLSERELPNGGKREGAGRKKASDKRDDG